MKRYIIYILLVSTSFSGFATGDDSTCKKLEQLSYVYAELKGFDGAKKYIDSMSNCEGSSSVILSKANSLYKEHKYWEALMEFENYFKLPELNLKQKAQAYINAGISANKLGLFDKSIELYKLAEKNGFSSTVTYYNIGISYYDKGEHDKSIEAYHLSLTNDNKYAYSWNNLGFIFEKKEDYFTALSYFAAAYKYSNDNDPLLMLNYGRCLRVMKKYDSALIIAKATAAKFPQYYPSQIELAKLYNFYTKDVKKALIHARKAVALAPTVANAYFELAFANSNVGYKDSALFYYAITLKLNPTEYVAYTNSSIIYKLYGYFDQAIECNLKALEIKPNYSYAYKNLQHVYQEKKDFENSIKYSSLNYKYGNDRPEDALGLGYNYLIAGHYHKAIPYLHEAIIARYEHFDIPYNNLGLAYTQLNILDSARYYLDTAYSINPKNSYNIHNRALYYYKIGNYDSACINLEKALELEYNWTIDPQLEEMAKASCKDVNLNRKINYYGYKGHFTEFADKNFIELINSSSSNHFDTTHKPIVDELEITEEEVKPSQSSLFTIYPNPTQGNVIISHSNNVTEKYTLDIYNINGQKVLTIAVSNPQTQIDLKALPKGLYVAIILQNNNVMYTEKVILE